MFAAMVPGDSDCEFSETVEPVPDEGD